MKVYYSNLLTKLTGIVGVTSISLVMGLSARAGNALNPNPSVFTEAPYNRNQIVPESAEANNKSVIRTSKSNKQNKTLLAQGGGALNPRPSILDECPYNRAACGNRAPSTSPEPLPPTTPAP